MSNQQILEKAIQKAIDGGWKPWVVVLADTKYHAAAAVASEAS